jgi:zinc protease
MLFALIIGNIGFATEPVESPETELQPESSPAVETDLCKEVRGLLEASGIEITDGQLNPQECLSIDEFEQLQTENEGEITAETGLEPGFLSVQLKNGLQVSILTAPDHPVVSTQTWVEIGGAHEADNERGFAHMFEHLMFGDTSNYDAKDYARWHVTYGGYENAYTAFDNTVYISEIPVEGHNEVLNMEADRLVNLVLNAENLDNEKRIVTEELRLRGENNPFSRLLNIGLKAMFGAHPYGYTPAGTKEDIQNADLELCRKFYAGYYQPENIHLVIVGPVNRIQTLTRVQELYGDINKEGCDYPP